MRASIIDGHHAGWQLAIHAIGDRAVDFTLDAVRKRRRDAHAPTPGTASNTAVSYARTNSNGSRPSG